VPRVSNLDQTHANTLLAYSLANGTGSPVATTGSLHCRLMITNGSATVNGTELSAGGSYVQGTGITPVDFSTAVSGTTSNSNALTQTNMPSATIVGAELWDSSVSPHRLWFGALSASKVVNSGDTFTIPIGSLTIGIG
jgi:hypothetical protein